MSGCLFKQQLDSPVDINFQFWHCYLVWLVSKWTPQQHLLWKSKMSPFRTFCVGNHKKRNKNNTFLPEWQQWPIYQVNKRPNNPYLQWVYSSSLVGWFGCSPAQAQWACWEDWGEGSAETVSSRSCQRPDWLNVSQDRGFCPFPGLGLESTKEINKDKKTSEAFDIQSS